MTVTGTAAGLLLATLAFALALVPARTRWRAAGASVVALLATALLAPAIPNRIALPGGWAVLIAVAIMVYEPDAVARRPSLTMSGALVAGGWAGVLLAPDGPWLAGVCALGFAGLLAAASLVVYRGWVLALRVATSWLVAVAIMVGAMPYFVAHPGYVADHRE